MRRSRSDRAFAAVLTSFGGAILLLLGLVVASAGRLSVPAFEAFGVLKFLVSTHWDPVQEQFGALPFIYGTVITSVLAIALAAPVSVGLALFLTQVASPLQRKLVSFLVELLAGIPSVVYGLWGLMVLVPFLRSTVEPKLGEAFGDLALFSGPPIGLGYLAAGGLLAIMIIPTIAALSVEVLRTVPGAQQEGAFALGATRWESIRMVVLPFARRGITGAVILGLARALGETMAVTMVIGNQPEISASLLAPGYSLPSVIANEFAEATSDVHIGALAGLALVLLGVTLLLNTGARALVGGAQGDD